MTERKWLAINLNRAVKIKLKPKGMIHLLEYHKKITGSYGDYVPGVDKDGYYLTQLHCLMSEFGETITLSSFQCEYFEMEILIEDDGKV